MRCVQKQTDYLCLFIPDTRPHPVHGGGGMLIPYLAMAIWPAVIVWLFANRTPASAASIAIIGGYLLLPRNVAINLPAVPPLDKDSITALVALLAAVMIVKGPVVRTLAPGVVLPGMVPRSRAVQLLLVGLFIATLGMVLTNGDPLRYGPVILPGMRPYDAAAMLGSMLFALLPFLLARKYLAHPETHTKLLVVLAVAGLLYSLPALWEVRMSPRLSVNIYGYFPHDWIQHVRAGGFRPVVFLHHGLWLAIFLCAAFLATLTLWRRGTGPNRTKWLIASGWMLLTLVLAKGVGALGIGLMLGAAILFLPLRLQVLGAAALAAIVLTYPTMRGSGLIPINGIVNLARSIDSERAGSLEYRLRNEDILLSKANERPLFGWGTWSRNRVYDAEGNDTSVTDGYWVIRIGSGGWIGYLATMGLLTVPLILIGLRWRRMGMTVASAGLSFALTANLIDLIPNATLTPVTWLLAGALAGRLELGRLADTAAPDLAQPLPERRNAYSRQRRHHPPKSPSAAIVLSRP